MATTTLPPRKPRGGPRRQSAGFLLYRRRPRGVELLLVHPGGPFWARKDDGAWSIPKGEIGEGQIGEGQIADGERTEGEDPRAAAVREVAEEMGLALDPAAVAAAIPLAPVRQAGGKTVHAWALETDFDPAGLRSNTFRMEWPPKSGRSAEFPEVDRAAWFSPVEARRKMLGGQVALVDELVEKLAGAIER